MVSGRPEPWPVCGGKEGRLSGPNLGLFSGNVKKWKSSKADCAPLLPRIRTVTADAGHQGHKLARELMREEGWKLQILKRRQRTFKIAGLTWIVERSFAWLGHNRRFSKDSEYRAQTSETMLD